MTEKNEHFHGSDLEKIEEIYHIPRKEIVSFASNVNPIGISPKLRSTLAEHIDDITDYPERAYTSLRKAIGQYISADYRHIIVGNGSSELISRFIERIHPKHALILSPTYSEYERDVHLSEGKCTYFPLNETKDFAIDTKALCDALECSVDLLILCNPNNPTSSAISREDMVTILEYCKTLGIYVLIDETYVEFSSDLSNITSIPLTETYDHVIILRGISKFFAAPGLRLGYAVCSNTQLLQNVLSRQDPWSINTLAAIAGEIMFSDVDYIQETRELIHTERERICKKLDTIDALHYYEPKANFILIKILKESITAHDVFEAAIKEKLMIRDCSDFPFLNDKFFRFCIMMPHENDLLLSVLETLFKS